jgi:hypothetical protein
MPMLRTAPLFSELGEQVLKFRLQGLTANQIARRMMISAPEVHKALDAILPQLDHVYRRRVIAESLLICDRVIGKQLGIILDRNERYGFRHF